MKPWLEWRLRGRGRRFVRLEEDGESHRFGLKTEASEEKCFREWKLIVAFWEREGVADLDD